MIDPINGLFHNAFKKGFAAYINGDWALAKYNFKKHII